jgi:hypothetical protein
MANSSERISTKMIVFIDPGRKMATKQTGSAKSVTVTVLCLLFWDALITVKMV